jgi:hypothetical protein
MRISISTAALAAVVAFASLSSAHALSVTNRDGTDQKVTITEGDKQRLEVVAPSKTLQNVCPAGCVIQLQNGEEYEFDGNEIVSIEEGLMFLDEPAAEENAAPGADRSSPAQPAPSAKIETPAAGK